MAHVIGKLGAGDVAKGAAAIARASADHADLDAVGFDWLRRAIQLRGPARDIAEATLNLSVAYAARYRFGEAEWVVRWVDSRVAFDEIDTARLAIARAAWRRRLIVSMLNGSRGIPLAQLIPTARDGLMLAERGVRLVPLAEGTNTNTLLRAQVRVAEALSVGFSVLAHSGNSDRKVRIQLATRARALFEVASQTIEGALENNYDRARLDVISDVADALSSNEYLTDFGILRRVRRLDGSDL